MGKASSGKSKSRGLSTSVKSNGNTDGLNMALRIAKQRSKNSKDITQPKIIKDEQGNVLKEDEDINSRWHRYFCKLLNEENESQERGRPRSIQKGGKGNHRR